MSLKIDYLLLAGGFREEFNNVQQGILFVIAKFCQGFSALLVSVKANWMHWSETTISMAVSNMLFFTYHIRKE